MLVGGIQTFRAWHTVAPEDVPDPLVPVTSYAEEESLRAGGVLPAAPLVGTGVEVDLDCTGLACPGPIMALQKKMGELNPGDEVVAHVSDIGFRPTPRHGPPRTATRSWTSSPRARGSWPASARAGRLSAPAARP